MIIPGHWIVYAALGREFEFKVKYLLSVLYISYYILYVINGS